MCSMIWSAVAVKAINVYVTQNIFDKILRQTLVLKTNPMTTILLFVD